MWYKIFRILLLQFSNFINILFNFIILENVKKKSANSTNAIPSLAAVNPGINEINGDEQIDNTLLPSPSANSVIPPPTVGLLENNFTCIVGDNQCRAVFRGAAWVFRTESSLISPCNKIKFTFK